MLGALGAMAPTRRQDFSKIVMRAMICGNVACFLTACISGEKFVYFKKKCFFKILLIRVVLKVSTKSLNENEIKETFKMTNIIKSRKSKKDRQYKGERTKGQVTTYKTQ